MLRVPSAVIKNMSGSLVYYVPAFTVCVYIVTIMWNLTLDSARRVCVYNDVFGLISHKITEIIENIPVINYSRDAPYVKYTASTCTKSNWIDEI